MNKEIIYSYILQLEKELKNLLKNNRFSDLIVSEIINASIIELHEIDNSSMSDEETAKGIVRSNINSFFTPQNIAKLEDKLLNWKDRVIYGFRGRIMPTPENILRLRMSLDITRREVNEEKEALMYAISNFKFEPNKVKKSKYNFSDLKFIASISAITIIAVIAIWRFSSPLLNKETDSGRLGEYVYIDENGKLHTNRKCSKLNYKGLLSDRVKPKDIQPEWSLTFCPSCVNDKDYENLLNYIHQ